MHVVSKTRTELTVARAQDGTVATTHSTGINVAVVNGQGTFTSDIYYVSVDLGESSEIYYYQHVQRW